jgi:hypothetical protein
VPRARSLHGTGHVTRHELPASQGIPSVQDRILWRTSLTKVLRLQSANQLIRPLGHWFPTEEQCRWFFDPSTERLYEKAGFEITYYSRAPVETLGSPTPGIPASAERATVECTAYLLWLMGNSPSSAFATSASGQALKDRLATATQLQVGQTPGPHLLPFIGFVWLLNVWDGVKLAVTYAGDNDRWSVGTMHADPS